MSTFDQNTICYNICCKLSALHQSSKEIGNRTPPHISEVVFSVFKAKKSIHHIPIQHFRYLTEYYGKQLAHWGGK